MRKFYKKKNKNCLFIRAMLEEEIKRIKQRDSEPFGD